MDKQLNIQTEGIQLDGKDSYHYHRYEPTPYEWLDALFSVYPLKSSDTLIDFGCGMGRLVFYSNYRFDCCATGIEMNPKYYDIALLNKKNYRKKGNHSLSFLPIMAQEYEIAPADNIFYFFNPFSPEIFMRVMNHIQRSLEDTPRHAAVILYYPDDEYISYLNDKTAFFLKETISVVSESSKQHRECFLVFEYSPM